MECIGGAHALLEDYLSVGAAACDALYCQRWEVYYYLKLVLTLKEPNNRLPGSYAWVVFIAGDTLHHQPMGVGHMTVLQFSWAYHILCPTMVSPNANWNIKEDKL